MTADVVIVGGGVIGASVAHHVLSKQPGWRVVLLEAAPEVGTGATSKATGGVRHQFSTAANIQLTLLSYPYFTEAESRLGRAVDFVRHGYLFVTTSEKTLAASRRSVVLQQSLGVRSEILPARDVGRFLDQLVTDDLVGASFCADDGSADPYSLLQAFLALARRRGLDVRTSSPVVAIETSGGGVSGVRTSAETISAPIVVDCAGPHADDVAAMAGVEVPSKPYRRQVMVAERMAGFPEVFPLIVDLDTGWYVHSQRSALLMGGTDKDQHPGHDTTVDWSAFSLVLEAAGKRVPPLAEARVMRAYAGVRDLTPDYHGILCESDVRGFYLACGFSGHGFMHSPAIGILMAELIVDGRAISMDIDALSLRRFARGTAAAEATMF